MAKRFTVGEFNKLIMESSNEFKAVLGAGVENGNKQINDKAYKDAKKRAKDFDGGGDEVDFDYDANDSIEKDAFGNLTTLDYEPENVTPEYKKRIEAQAEGYTSADEKNNKIEKSGNRKKNKAIFNSIKKAGQKHHKANADLKATGLQASKMPKGTFDKEEMYESKYPTAWFKKTTFLTEGHMESKIPDEFKVNGKKFNMKDKTGNSYLLEWRNSNPVILSHSNKKGLNESLSRMKSLMGFASTDTKTTNDMRLNEGEVEFNNTLAKMRRIIK